MGINFIKQIKFNLLFTHLIMLNQVYRFGKRLIELIVRAFEPNGLDFLKKIATFRKTLWKRKTEYLKQNVS